MFGYNFNQNATGLFHPVPNNYCGGFSLDAVRFNGTGTPPHPMQMYSLIQGNQAGVGPNSVTLIGTTAIGGTAICLPSSIAITARHYFPVVNVLYGNLPAIFTPPIVGEETARLGAWAIPVPPTFNLQTLLAKRTDRYYIALVHVGQHWIALKREVDNTFYGYDPGTGADVPVTITGNHIAGAGIDYHCNELVIAIQ